MDEEKTIIVGNIPPFRFFGGPKKQGITGNIQVSLDPEILVVVVTKVSVPMQEALYDIGVNIRKVMI